MIIAICKNLATQKYFKWNRSCFSYLPRCTPLDVALRESHPPVVDLLLQHGGHTRSGTHHSAACLIQAVWRFHVHKVHCRHNYLCFPCYHRPLSHTALRLESFVHYFKFMVYIYMRMYEQYKI